MKGHVVKNMVLIALFLSSMSFIATEARAEGGKQACGTAYPKNFPCIAGGHILDVNLGMAMPGTEVPKVIVIAYPRPYKDVFDILLKDAEHLAWTTQSNEAAKEPDGIRYRASFVQNQRIVSLSVYENHRNKGWAMVQIMEFAGVPAQ
jgi:hypothetical protein